MSYLKTYNEKMMPNGVMNTDSLGNYIKPESGIPKSDLSEEVQETLESVPQKQETLVSGENIRTINNESILGEGNIAVTAQTYVIDNTPNADSDNLVKSGGVAREIVWDVTARNSNATFASLSALLSDANLATLIPTTIRRGGMQIRFVHSNDNNYVQYFLTKDEWSASEADWEKMNLEKEFIQLESTIDNAVREEGEEQSTTYGDEALTESGYIKKGDNYTIQSDQNYLHTDFIDISDTDSIHVKCSSSSSSGNIVAVSFYTDNDLASAIQSSSIFFTGSAINQYVEKPSGAHYIIISNSSNTTSYKFELVLSKTIKGSIIKSSDLQEAIAEQAVLIQANSEDIQDNSEDIQDISEQLEAEESQAVALDKTYLTQGNFVRVSGDSKTNREGYGNYYSTDYISTDGVSNLHVKCNIGSALGTVVAVAFFTEKDSLADDADLPHLITENLITYGNSPNIDADITIPINAKYFRVSNGNPSTYNLAITYTKIVKVDRLNKIEGDITDNTARIETLESKTNVLQGKNIVLIGASFAYPDNGWFEYAALKYGFIGTNRGRSGTYMYDVALNFIGVSDATHWYCFSDDIIRNCDVLAIMYTHNLDCYNGADLQEDWHDYVPSNSMSDAAAYDYVIKRFLDKRLELGVKTLPKIILCTHWHNGRTVFNESVRSLSEKWGFPMVEFDMKIGASAKVNHPRLVDINDNALSPTIYHALYPIADHNQFPDEGHSYKGCVECDMLSADGSTYQYDAETLNGIICAWHPDRKIKKTIESPSTVVDTGVYPEIQKAMGIIFGETLKEMI